MTSELPFIVANDALEDADTLTGLLDEHGYLYFRGIVPREPILQARRDIFQLCSEAGWIAPNTDLMEGIWSGQGPYFPGDPEYMEVYRKVIDLASFNELPHYPALLSLVERILGGEALVHARKIGRITFPKNEGRSTPPHQDWELIRGTTRTYTVWMPLGNCPRSLGGLAILKGSHNRGSQQHVPMKGPGGTGVELGQEDGQWHTSDMAIGDCVLFHSLTIHKALPNVTGKYLRLSTDNRYQLAADEVDPSSMKPHHYKYFAQADSVGEAGNNNGM